MDAKNSLLPETKVALPAILAVSLLAVLFLFWLIYFQEAQLTEAAWINYLPYVNASLNGTSALCLILGFRAIKQGNKQSHMRLMRLAFVASSLFLVSYIIYHHFHGDTRFLATGLIRPIYFFTLISHIGLSIVALPMVFTTFYFALTRQFERHKALAKWTYPIWLYVSITGVLIVAFLKLFNPAS